MPDIERAVEAHYTRGDLGEAILAALSRAGKGLENLRPEDLAPVDEFYIGGRKATIELARLAHRKV
jgi:MPBQ/MSBQ methyltransferase